jgi:hypothetical protein
MADNNIAPRPLWVRFFARPGSRRPAVRSGAVAFCLLALIALLVCLQGAASESVLGRTAFAIGAALAPVAALLAVGAFLALRWVDRNGTWG